MYYTQNEVRNGFIIQRQRQKQTGIYRPEDRSRWLYAETIIKTIERYRETNLETGKCRDRDRGDREIKRQIQKQAYAETKQIYRETESNRHM